MNTTSIHLQENNLAEVLAGVSIASIAEMNSPHETYSSWSNNCLHVNTPLAERSFIDAIHRFLTDLKWQQGFGEVYQGCFSSSGKIGTSPFLDFADMEQTSCFKTFSGQVTPQKICDDLIATLEQVSRNSIAEYLTHTVSGIGSWALDWRTNGHSLDLGYSGNDDKTSKHNPVFVAVEMLAVAALAFFLPYPSLMNTNDRLRYNLWEHEVPGDMISAAFIGDITSLPSKAYVVARRPKSYGKGASYKYFPNSTLIL